MHYPQDFSRASRKLRSSQISTDGFQAISSMRLKGMNLRVFRGQFLLLSIIVLAGAIGRFHGLHGRYFTWDDIALYHYTLMGQISGPHEGPLLPWITRIVMYAFGSTEPVVFFMLPALFGSLAIVSTYALGNRLGGQKVAILSAFFVAFHPLIVQGAFVGRPYSLYLFVFPIAVLYYLRSSDEGNFQNYFILFVSLVCTALTHLFACLLIPCFCAHSLVKVICCRFDRKSIRNAVAILVISVFALGIGSVWAFVRTAVTSVLEGRAELEDSFLWIVLRTLGPDPLLQIDHAKSQITSLSNGLFIVAPIILGVLFCIGVLELFKSRRFEIAVVLIMLLLVPGTVLYFTLGWKTSANYNGWSWSWYRYLMPLIPAYAIGIGLGIVVLLSHFKSTYLQYIPYFFLGFFLPSFLICVGTRSSSDNDDLAGSMKALDAYALEVDDVVFERLNGVYGDVTIRAISLFLVYSKMRVPIYISDSSNQVKELETVSLEPDFLNHHVLPMTFGNRTALKQTRHMVINFWGEVDCAEYSGKTIVAGYGFKICEGNKNAQKDSAERQASI